MAGHNRSYYMGYLILFQNPVGFEKALCIIPLSVAQRGRRVKGLAAAEEGLPFDRWTEETGLAAT
jgi:hypothetical protein